jgi:hypothetical protein
LDRRGSAVAFNDIVVESILDVWSRVFPAPDTFVVGVVLREEKFGNDLLTRVGEG